MSINEKKDEIIKFAIPLLPPKYIDVVRLRYIENKTYKQIGEALNITKDNAYKRMQRATKELQIIWNTYKESGLSVKKFEANSIKMLENIHKKKALALNKTNKKKLLKKL